MVMCPDVEPFLISHAVATDMQIKVMLFAHLCQVFATLDN